MPVQRRLQAVAGRRVSTEPPGPAALVPAMTAAATVPGDGLLQKTREVAASVRRQMAARRGNLGRLDAPRR